MSMREQRVREDIEEKWMWEKRSESERMKETTPNDDPCKRIIPVAHPKMRKRCRRTQKLMWMFCMQICVRLFFFLSSFMSLFFQLKSFFLFLLLLSRRSSDEFEKVFVIKRSNCVYVRGKKIGKARKKKFHCKNVMTIEHTFSDAMANTNMLEQKGFPLF